MSNTNKDIDAEKFKDMVIDMTRKERLELIKKADIAYYNDDAPIMSDAEYDKLRNEYIAEFGNEELNYVPGNTTSEFRPFIHTEPVSSLGKVKESLKFSNVLKLNTENPSYSTNLSQNIWKYF